MVARSTLLTVANRATAVGLAPEHEAGRRERTFPRGAMAYCLATTAMTGSRTIHEVFGSGN